MAGTSRLRHISLFSAGMFSGALDSPSRPCDAEHSTALDTGHTGPTAKGLFRYTMEDATTKPLSVPKPSQSTSTGSQEEKVPGVVTSLFHTIYPLSHCPWIDFSVQNKTTDDKDTVGPSCSSWHPLESRGCFCDLCAQIKSNELKKAGPQNGLYEWISKTLATDGVGKKHSPEEQSKTMDNLDTLCWG